jgi:class 3 adenylate cyclase/predicted ATPase
MEVQGTLRCPSCGHGNRRDRRFCTECGSRLGLTCAACGAAVEPSEKFCGSCGTALREDAAVPRPAEAPLPAPDAAEGERRQLTVLFCDLVGSTSLSQQLDAEEWRDLIAQYQQAASAAVGRFGGHVARKLGDGLLIYFGWPTARDDDPERAVRAGLAIVDALGPLNGTLAAGDGPRLAVRIGLHTGPVVIADGDEVFGETPNIAARVQGAAEPDTVVITEATQRLVAGMFVVENRGPQMLQGVREPVTLYRVVQPSGVRSRLAVAAGRLTPFVGREVELATLGERWERAQDGEGQTVLVLGEAGVGKSRLVYQFHEHLTAVPHTWLECGATPYTEGTPFHPVITLVAQGLALAPGDTVAEQLGKLESGLGALASPEAVAVLAAFLGLPPPTPLQMSPDLQRRKTIDLLVQWTLALSAVQPLVVVVEDLQWCDASTLELLGHVIAQSATARVLLLATARPEFTPPWSARSNLTTLQLARLTTRQARDMVTALGGPEVAVTTRDALVARADGVPLYLEELTRAVAESAAAHGAAAVPETLADSLMARLDRLSAAKEVAQRAAVLGREFGYPLLAATAGLDEAALRHGLARLVDAEILFARGAPPAATYSFKHALIQETAYQSLLKRTRQQLHARVAQILEERFPERVAAEPEVVARNAEAGGLTAMAVTYYQRAGERAQERSAHEEAIQHLRQAIALQGTCVTTAEHEAREAGLHMVLAESLVAIRGYHHAETEAAYERARALFEAVGDPVGLGGALCGLSSVHSSRAELGEAIGLAERVLAIGGRSGQEALLPLAHVMLAVTRYYQGRFDLALANAEEQLSLRDRGRQPRLEFMFGGDWRVGALGWAAWSLWQLGHPDRALARAEQAVAHGRGTEHPFSLAFALFLASVVHSYRGDRVAQRESAAELIDLADAQGFQYSRGLGHICRGHARAALGDAVAGLAEVREGMKFASPAGTPVGAPALFEVLAETLCWGGQVEEALGMVDTGLAMSAQTGQPFHDANLHRLKGELLLATRSSREADSEGCFRSGLEIARVQKARSFELRAATSLARLWQRQGKRREARALLAPVYAWFTEGFDTGDLVEAKALLEELT